jgi:hypothetical protein
MLRCESQDPADGIVLDLGVRVQEQNKASCGELEGLIVRRRETEVLRVRNESDRREFLNDHLRGAVPGCVIHQDDLKAVTPRLGKYGLEAAPG